MNTPMTKTFLMIPRMTLRTTIPALIVFIGLWACLAAPARAADPGGFAGHWEDCDNFADACYGYRLDQKGAKVCGSLTRASKADAPRTYGHIRGEQSGELLVNVAVCGIESRSTCPQVVPANRRGLLLCGDQLFETGGRRPSCAEMADQPINKPYRRVTAKDFANRFGPSPAPLCEVPVSSASAPATPPPPSR